MTMIATTMSAVQSSELAAQGRNFVDFPAPRTMNVEESSQLLDCNVAQIMEIVALGPNFAQKIVMIANRITGIAKNTPLYV